MDGTKEVNMEAGKESGGNERNNEIREGHKKKKNGMMTDVKD